MRGWMYCSFTFGQARCAAPEEPWQVTCRSDVLMQKIRSRCAQMRIYYTFLV